MKKRLGIILPFALTVCIIVLMMTNCSGNNPEKPILPESENTSSEEVTKYTVTFFSNDGTVLKIDSVDENSSAAPPVTPEMAYGAIFQSWDTDFSKVTQDLNIRPVCETVNGKQNVIAVPGVYAQNGSTVVVPIRFCGEVCVSGLDVTIRYDEQLLKLKSVNEDKAVICNSETPGVIRLNYVSVENTIADVDICDLYFLVEASEGVIPIDVEIQGIYAFEDSSDAENFTLFVPEANVINGKIFVLQ